MTKATNLQHFHKFWSVVWRKVGKLEAERKFYIALKRQHKELNGKAAEFIIEAAEKYTESVKGKNPQFLPHPTTWLHQGRYYDELEPPTPPDFNAGDYARKQNENNRVH